MIGLQHVNLSLNGGDSVRALLRTIACFQRDVGQGRPWREAIRGAAAGERLIATRKCLPSGALNQMRYGDSGATGFWRWSMTLSRSISLVLVAALLAAPTVVLAADDGELKVTGGTAQRLRGANAGAPLASMRGIKAITSADWKQMQAVPKTGLFLVDTDYVPLDLAANLKKMGYSLASDGTLTTATGKLAVLFVKNETYRIAKNAVDNHETERSLLGRLRRVASELAHLVVPDVKAANPYPWNQFSWSYWWHYPSGFCRTVRASVTAEAWGPPGAGGARPHTRIQYIETRIDPYGRRNSCTNCDSSRTDYRWHVGCFWPAYGHGGFTFVMFWRDGGVEVSRVFRSS